MPTLQKWIDCEGLPVAKCNGYRRHRGLPPLPDNATAPPAGSQQKPGCGKSRTAATVKQPATEVWPPGPGTELLRMYEAAGVPSCQACKDLARRMNEWGSSGCRERLDQIVAEIMPRAKAWVEKNRPWIHKLLPNVIEEAGIRHRVRGDVVKVIEAAEAKE